MKIINQYFDNLRHHHAFRSLFWMISEKLIRLLLGVFVTAIVARHLGPAQFGELSFSLALLSILIVVSSLGLNRIFIREIVSSIEHVIERRRLLSTVLAMRILVSTILWCVAVLLSHWWLPENWYLISLVMISMIFSATDIIDFYQQAESDVKGISIARTVAFIASALSRCLLVWLDANPVWFFAALTFEYFVTALALLTFHRLKHGGTLLRLEFLDRKTANSLLRESWPEIIAGFGAILFMRMDQIMLKSMSGSEAVGIYSAAIRLSEAWYFVPTALVAATFPMIIKSREESLQGYHKDIEILMVALVFMAILFALGMILFALPLIQLIYGEGYIESSKVLVLHSLGGVFLCLGIASGSWLAAEKSLIFNLYRNIAGLLMNFCLNFLLIPRYGVQGAAIATVSGLATAFLLFDIVLPSQRIMFVMKVRALLFMPLIEKLFFDKQVASDIHK